jgi:hypothetical protein
VSKFVSAIAIFICLIAFQSKAFAMSDCEAIFLDPQEQGSEVIRELDSAIQETSSNADMKGYAFLVGGMIANAAVSAGITTWVNPGAEFLPTMVGYTLGQVTFITASLLSPFSEPLSAKIRRFAFGLKSKGNTDVTRTANSALESKADAIHSTYTLREQYATDRIFVFRNALRLNFQTAALAFETGDQTAVIAEVADAAMAGYQYFKDIDPREPAIVNAIHASFLVKVKDPSHLIEPILALIRARDPDYDSKAEAYYERAMKAWLGVQK